MIKPPSLLGERIDLRLKTRDYENPELVNLRMNPIRKSSILCHKSELRLYLLYLPLRNTIQFL